MKKAEFIKTFADSVAKGRKKHYPDIRPSEAAVSRIDDERRASVLWRQHREHYTHVTVQEFEEEINEGFEDIKREDGQTKTRT